MITCEKCGSVASPAHASGHACALCGQVRLDAIQVPSPDQAPSGTPWERVGTLGLLPALIATVKGVLFAPDRFFSARNPTGSTFMALLFALLMGSLQTLFNSAWSAVPLPGLGDSWSWLGDATSGGGSGSSLILTPLLTLTQLCAIAVYFHLGAWLTRTKTHPVSSTFRVLCYASAAGLWEIIPLAGTALSMVWFVCLVIFGQGKNHGISVARCLAVFALPLAVVGAVSVAALALLAGAGLAVGELLKELPSFYR